MTRRIETKTQVRSAKFDRAAIDRESRTAQLAFSSEEPYDRYFGREILDHAPSSVRLGRLADRGALLLDHDPSQHIGVVEDVAIGEDRVGRATVRFGRSATAEAAFQDVVDGIRTHVSVGYLIHKMKLEQESKDGPSTYRVTSWEPLEVSLVAIPADPTVGVGRAFERSITTEVEGELPEEPVAEPAPEPEPAAEPTPAEEAKSTPIEVRIMTEPNQHDAQRVTRLAELGEQYSKYVTQKDVADAIRGNSSVEAFQEVIMGKIATKHAEPTDVSIGMSKKEKVRYSLSRALAAMMSGDWKEAGLERECSVAAEKIYGRQAEGFWLPPEALSTRDFTAGTAAEAGNLIATELRDDLFTDVLRNALVLGRSGATILTGLTSNLAIPRKTVAGTVAAVNEVAAASETQPTTAQVSLAPNRISAFVQASKRAIIQSSMSVEALLRQDLLDGTSVLFENYAINGTGTAPQPRGIRNTSGIGSVAGGTNGLALAWSHLVDLESACANSNAEPDRFAGYLVNTKVRGTAKKTQKATNLPFIWDNGDAPLNGYRALVTNNVPSNLTKGSSSGVCSSVIFSSDFRMLVLAVFGGFDITVDPYSQKNSGMVEIAINAYVDVGVRQPACFASMDDALTP